MTNSDDQHDIEFGGFDSIENEFTEEFTEEVADKPVPRIIQKPQQDVWRQNFNAVFGHGAGKIALYSAVGVAIVMFAVAVRGFSSTAKSEKVGEFDLPSAPKQIHTGAVSEKEARRRAEIANEEAESALQNGETYQPGFDYDIRPEPKYADENALFDVPVQSRYEKSKNNAANNTAPAADQPVRTSKNPSRVAQALQRREKEYQQMAKDRDEYIDEVKGKVLEQVSAIFAEKSNLNTLGSYSVVNYSIKNDTGMRSSLSDASGNTTAVLKRKILIKTGALLYATLDSEVSTDDGGLVLATVRNGDFNGAKLIGRIEQAPNNIRLRFNTLSPQDERATLSISAIALRESDAKQGVAENIDHHTLERYASLAVASIFKGLGDAASINTGTTVIHPSGTVASTNEKVSNRRMVGMIAGEIGDGMSDEIRRGFNRPPTYSIPAQHGIGVFFLQDVVDEGASR